jgi:hypothetical protein
MNQYFKLLVGMFFMVSSTTEACKFAGQAGKGFVAGAAATVLVDMGKPYAVDLMQKNGIDIIKLSEKYKLNGERIISDVTNGIAILGVSAVDKLWCGKKGVGLISLTARLAGIFGGSATARYVTKIQNQATPEKSAVASAS